jgi:hypothetical protein
MDMPDPNLTKLRKDMDDPKEQRSFTVTACSKRTSPITDK